MLLSLTDRYAAGAGWTGGDRRVLLSLTNRYAAGAGRKGGDGVEADRLGGARAGRVLMDTGVLGQLQMG